MKRFLGIAALLLMLADCGDFQWFPDANPNVDTTPVQFAFTNKCAEPLNTDIASNSITITGINASTLISISTGEYSLDNGANYRSDSTSISNNATVLVRPTGPNISGGKVTALGTYTT